MKYIVYLTTNLTNGKIYIGVHGTDTPELFDGYLGCGINRFHKSLNSLLPKTPFQYAVKKYGYDNFKRQTLRIFSELQDALDLERWLVDDQFIQRSDTYNTILGGGIPPTFSKKIYQYSAKGEYISEYSSIQEAGKCLNISPSAIGNGILYKHLSGGFLWSTEKYPILNIDTYNIVLNKIPVYMYDRNGNFEKEFQSETECFKYLEDDISYIQRAIMLQTCVKGHYLSKIKVDKFEGSNPKRLVGQVHQYSLDGKYLKSYSSIKDVEKDFNESMKGINESIKLGRQYKGFLWLRGQKQEKVKPCTNKKIIRKVAQYSLDGTLIKVYNSTRACREVFPNVGKVLNGRQKSTKGFIFKYIE